MLGRAPQHGELAARHLRLWLHALNRVLAEALRVQRALGAELGRALGTDQAQRSVGITDTHAASLLAQLDHAVAQGAARLPALALSSDEARVERTLIESAQAARAPLPLHHLRDVIGLDSSELTALLILAAPQLHSGYERVYGYLADDLTRLHPDLELVLRLTAGQGKDEATLRLQLGPHGRLRRLRLVRALDEPQCGAKLRLALGPDVFGWLAGTQATPPFLRADPALIEPDASDRAYPVDAAFTRALAALRGTSGCVGVWGLDGRPVDNAVLAMTAALERPIFRFEFDASETGIAPRIEEAALAAAAHDAVLWVRLDLAAEPAPTVLGQAAEYLALLHGPLILSGNEAWRPVAMLARRTYAELRVAGTPGAVDTQAWTRACPGLSEEAARRLTDRFQLDRRQRTAALGLASTMTAPPVEESTLVSACALVTAPEGGRFARVIEPRRGPEDLVLPEPLHTQVLEIGAFYAHAARVDGRWGFGRMCSGPGGLKVLFTGEPGTGKTLASEVIARTLRLMLLKVDLSQVVSKWVGETEKNLEQVFRQAESSQAVLFFDEADTLFGKRGEIRHGTDRYSNLEVGYLLQRLESFGGLVILASNLRDEIDPAFTRRFQITLHFPRPAPQERRRMWRLAFAEAPLDADVELDSLVDLDLTGAGIMTSARLAGLLAAAEDAPAIARSHIAEAIRRQFRQEARLLRGRALAGIELPPPPAP